VLFLGEPGTGKELFADLYRIASPKKTGPYVPYNSPALSGGMEESAMFGHVKGAFTGAIEDHEGLFQQAHDGTLFLDEIGELDIRLQPRLLRVLESNKVRPVGAVKEIDVNVQLVCATNKDLHKMRDNGQFREDLFSRIAPRPVRLPPLRDRREDISLLAEHFVISDDPARKISHGAFLPLQSYGWQPANIRDLKSFVECYLHLRIGRITRTMVKEELVKFERDYKGNAQTLSDEERVYRELRELTDKVAAERIAPVIKWKPVDEIQAAAIARDCNERAKKAGTTAHEIARTRYGLAKIADHPRALERVVRGQLSSSRLGQKQ